MNTNSVVKNRLCTKCGMCAAVCPASCIEWTDSEQPLAREDGCSNCGICLDVCPGAPVATRRRALDEAAGISGANPPQLWVGAACEREIRHAAASGGFITAFAIDLLSRGRVDGVIVTRGEKDTPFINRAFVARTREELLEAMGSRYAPSPACLAVRGLNPSERYAFVGKPCDVDAVRRLQGRIQKYANCITLTVSLICAGVPKPSALMRLLQENKIDVGDIGRVRYRGNGWPGIFSVTRTDGSEFSMSYHEAWGRYLSRERSVRCALCDDPFALKADIVAGDPWGDEYKSEMEGLSLVLLRSSKGIAEFEARSAGVFDSSRLPAEDLLRLQGGLRRKFENHPVERVAYHLAVTRRIRPERIPGGIKGLYRLARRVAYYIAKKPD